MLHGLTVVSTKVGPIQRAYPYADPQSHPDWAAATERERVWRVDEIADTAPRTLGLGGGLVADGAHRFTSHIELEWAITRWMDRDDESAGSQGTGRKPSVPPRSVPAGYMRVRYVQIGHLHTRDIDLWAITRSLDTGSGAADIVQYLNEVTPNVKWSDTPIARSKNQIARQFIALVDADKGFADKLVRVRISS